MRKRTHSRELALQILYKMDICREESSGLLESFWKDSGEEPEPQVKDFSAELVRGVEQNLAVIDQKISQYADNWKLERMAYVDRNILRLGCFELLFREDIPAKVSINEAVELAKKFSSADAGKFVNGILDKIKSQVNK
jgi:transcription antitermination factor NusB